MSDFPGKIIEFFFFFEVKIFSFRQKESYHHKIHRQYTLGLKQKICPRNCHKNHHLLIFDDCGKIFDFWQSLEFSEAHFFLFFKS